MSIDKMDLAAIRVLSRNSRLFLGDYCTWETHERSSGSCQFAYRAG